MGIGSKLKSGYNKVKEVAAPVTKPISKAVDQIGNISESAVNKTRDEAARNLGTDGSRAFLALSDVASGSLNKAGGAVENASKGNIGQAGRAVGEMAIDAATPLGAIKSGMQLYGKYTESDLNNVRIDANMQSPEAPSESAVDQGLRDDAALADQAKDGRRRGRASTVLTSPQGLLGQAGVSSRRTLMGA